MRLSIYTRGIDFTESVKRQTYNKLSVALDRIEDEVESIRVSLVDTNGPWLGGVDKACRISVSLHEQDAIVVEGIERSVEGVLDRVTDRLGVIACQRADARKCNSRQYRGYVDSDSWKDGL